MAIVTYSKDAPFSGIRRDNAGVALHFSPHFDPNKPAVMVTYFHGHGFALERDLETRQKVVSQFMASGVNGVLVAPQLMYDSIGDFKKAPQNKASYAGNLQNPDGPRRFYDQTAVELSKLSGIPAEKFKNMPIVINSYSGGFSATAAVLEGAMNAKDKTLLDRIKGVNLMDSLFAREETFARYVNQTKGFLNNGYIAIQYDEKGRPHPSSRVKNTANLQELISPAAAARVNNFTISSIGHAKLVEGDHNTPGAFAKGLRVAALQNYRAARDAPVAAQNRGPASPPMAAGHTQNGSATPSNVSYTSHLSSWAFNLLPKRVQNLIYPPVKDKKPAPGMHNAKTTKPSAPIHTAQGKPPEKPKKLATAPGT